jgi:hypothetical protein
MHRVSSSQSLHSLYLRPVENLGRFLPSTLVVKLKEGPEAMLEAFDTDSDTPELIWDATMRAELRKVIGKLLGELLAARSHEGGKDESFTVPPGAVVRYAILEMELFIGGVYVSRFLKEPTFNLRDPTSFLEHLLQRWTKELETYTNPADGNGAVASSSALIDAEQDVLSTVTTACVYVCKVRDTLCDKLAEWGYMARILSFLDAVLERDLVGAPLLSVLRLLHVAAGRLPNVEALAFLGHGDSRKGVVNAVTRSINSDPLHKDSAFMIEIMKKIYEVGLGDLKRARPPRHDNHMVPQPDNISMAPSPAPGEGPVRRRVDAWDDPLAMMGQPATAPANTRGGTSSMRQTPTAMSQNSSYNPNVGMHQMDQTQTMYRGAAMTSPGLQSRQLHQTTTAPSTQVPMQQQFMQPSSTQIPMQQQFMQPSSTQVPMQQQFMQPSSTTNSQYGHQTGHQSYPERSIASRQPAQAAPPSYQYGAPQNRQVPHAYGTAHPAAPQPTRLANPHFAPQQTQQVYQQPVLRQQGQQPYQVPGPVPQSAQGGMGMPSHTQPGWPQRQQLQPGQQYQAHAAVPQQTEGGTERQSQPIHNVVSAAQPGQHLPQQPWNSPYGQGTSQQDTGSSSSNTSFMQHHPRGSSGPPINPSNTPQTIQSQHPNAAFNGSYAPQPQTNMQQSSTMHGYGADPSFPPSHFPQQPAQQYAGGPMHATYASAESISTFSQPTMQLIVETVRENAPEPLPVPQYRPTPVEGYGVDARTQEDPKVEAEQRAVSSAGAPGAAKGRVALLQQALACELCDFLVNRVLENPDLKSVRDPAAVKVHAIALLKMLTKDPGYGPKFKLILSGLPAWAKYRSQDHSLLITGHEQKADYFLTDGGTGDKKLLTQG